MLAGVIVAVPPDLEAQAMRTLEFGLPAEALRAFRGVEGMPVFVYLFSTQARCPCHVSVLHRSLGVAWQ